MNTPKRKSTQERKSEIVDAALGLSLEVGPGRITTEALAKRVGVSHGAIFRHFATKAEIWSAVFETLSKTMAQGWRDAEPAASACGRLRALVRAQLRLVVAVPALPAILFSRELHHNNAALKKGVMAVMKRFHGILSGEIEAGIKSGELRAGIEANEAAFLIISMLQGTILRWSLGNRKFDLIAEGDNMLTLVMGGLETRE